MQRAVEDRIKERLLSESIACHKQLLPPPVINREREHPFEAFDASRSKLLVGVQDRLRVGRCLKTVSPCFQERPERAVVVDFSVEGNPAGAILVAHRLMSASAIDDGQATVPKCDTILGVESFTVRAAVGKRRRHRVDGTTCTRRQSAIQTVDAGYSAHITRPPYTRRRTAGSSGPA